MAGRMTPLEVAAALAGLPGWSAEADRALVRRFKFNDHVEAMGFVVAVAMVAEVMNHHPEIRIVYDTVDVRLTSHDAAGVTERDVTLAERISPLA